MKDHVIQHPDKLDTFEPKNGYNSAGSGNHQRRNRDLILQLPTDFWIQLLNSGILDPETKQVFAQSTYETLTSWGRKARARCAQYTNVVPILRA